MNKTGTAICAFILIVLGVALLFSRSDREFKNVIPSEGAENAITLESSSIYTLTMPADRSNLTRFGLYLSPLTRNLPDSSVTVTVHHKGEQVAKKTIPAVFINDNEGVTQLTFSPPVPLEIGEDIQVSISIPEELSRKIGLQVRLADDTFNVADSEFVIDGVLQENPAAYQAYYAYRPPLALQLGALMILLGVYVFAHKRFVVKQRSWLTIYVIVASLLFVLPGFLLGTSYVLLAFTAAISLSGMYILLRSYDVSIIPALFAAHVFAFTTWFPLHYIAGRPDYLLVGVLPWIVVLLRSWGSLSVVTKRISLIAAALVVIILIVVPNSYFTIPNSSLTAHPKDIFLDPNQVPSSQKIEPSPYLAERGEIEIPWDNFGSYIGVPALVFSFIGLVFRGKRYPWILLIGIAGALLALVPPIASSAGTVLPFPPQHSIILATFSLAFFAGVGLMSLKNYLGKQDNFVTFIVFTITLISLLDLWHIAAGTLEYPLL